MDESAAEAHAFVGFADVEAADFGHGLIWPWLDGDDGDDGAVDFHDVVAVDGGADFVAGACDEFVVGDGGADHADDGVDVVAAGGADALIGVAVDHGADAFDAEEFAEECVVGAAVEEVDAGDPAFAGAGGVAEEEDLAAFGFGVVRGFGGEGAGFVDGELADAAVFGVFDDACADEEELGGVEGDGDFDGDGCGIEAERAALAFAAAWWDERGDALVDELLERLGVDAVDGAGVAEVTAADDACGVDGDGIGDCGAEADASEVLEHGGGEPADGVDGSLEGGFVGDAGSVWAGECDAAAGGEFHDLESGTEDDDDADTEGMEDGEVEEDVAEVFVADDGAVDENDERLAAELGDVAQNAADIVVFHRAGVGGGDQGRASVGPAAGKSTMV